MSNKTKRESEIQLLEQELAHYTSLSMNVKDVISNSRPNQGIERLMGDLMYYSHEMGVISERMRRLTVRKTRFFRRK